ncbi:rod outer segment membrane protein 1 [Antechinus flavipes]|uniref:rod outer segment membrane protein 1 n=1 Tax=Antechinus flavipes TaxID=38775 RepID=UPI002235678C|nr:rod outer segment membrane protein 1 [Antechinus flavipes]
MAAILPLPLALQARVRLAQGLWLLSWLLALVGGLTLLSSGHLLVQLRLLSPFLDPACSLPALPKAALAAGAAALGLGVLGAGATRAALDAARYPPWRGVLGPILLAGTVGGGGLLALAAGLALALPQGLDAALEKGLGAALDHYKDTEVPGHCNAKRQVDELQLGYQCCGRHGPRDWFAVQWISSRYLDPTDQDVMDQIQSNVEGRYLIDGVPFSCCNPHSPWPCLQRQLSSAQARPLSDPRQLGLNLWERGCHGVLLGHLRALAGTLGTLLGVTFFLQVLLLLGLRYLQTALEGLGGAIDGEGETQGYLFPGGLKEMLKSISQQGLCAQRPRPEEAPAEEAPDEEAPAEEAAAEA